MAQNHERRQEKRLDVGTAGISATVHIDGEKVSSPCVVPLLDFSRGGACLYMGFKLDAPTTVTLKFDNLGFAPLEGTVAWCSPVGNDPDAPKTAKFRIGVSFVTKDRAAKDNLDAIFDHISALADEADDQDDNDEN